MVRGNWQKRVELAEARRVAAKQRKKQRDNRGMYKSMVLDLLTLLDRHGDSILRQWQQQQQENHSGDDRNSPWKVHVWTDSPPSDNPPIRNPHETNHHHDKEGDNHNEDDEEQKHHHDTKTGRRRAQSGSLGGEPNTSSSGQKGRGRSNSTTEPTTTGVSNSAKKKVHPRSKEAAVILDPMALDDSAAPKQCQTQFFTGRCENFGKKAGCRHVHLSLHEMTLATVLLNQGSGKKESNASKDAAAATAKEVLALGSAAMAISQNDDATDNGMDMLYHLPIDVSVSQRNNDAPLKVSDIITNALSEKSCTFGSIVYLTVNNMLLFDRYRDGVVVTDSEIQAILIGGDERRLRSSSVVSVDAEGDLENLDGDILLSGPLLEHIITFLPDSAVATMAMVCQAWYNEIGQTSPALWKHLLQRRNWPLPDAVSTALSFDNADGQMSARDIFRESFLSHYLVIRDMEAFKLGFGVITNTTKRVTDEKDMVYQAFSARRSAPQFPNICVAMEVWSPNTVLAAYSHDCTLRLFKAVGKAADGASPRACRELVCVSVNPYKNSKKRTCSLVAMALDEEVIGCLCHVMAECDARNAFLLIVVSRDGFLCADTGTSNELGGSLLDEDALHIIDVGEAVLNFLITCDDAEFGTPQLQTYLEDGADILDIDVVVSKQVVSCGYGRFLVQVTLYDPDYELYENILVDWKFVMFSAASDSIVWVGSTNPLEAIFLPHHLELTMSCLRHSRSGDSRTACSLAISARTSSVLFTAVIDPESERQYIPLVQASSIFRDDIISEDWGLEEGESCPCVVTPTDVIVVDSLYRHIEGIRDRKSILSFHPRCTSDVSYDTLTLEGNCAAFEMRNVRDDHIVVFCRVYMSKTVEEEVEDFDGNGVEKCRDFAIYIIVVHVPTRTEIKRICVLEDVPPSIDFHLPLVLASAGNTVGVCVSGYGVVLTGNDVRAVGGDQMRLTEDEQLKNSKKKKKKRQHFKSGKKDGFARGMSLRG